MRKIKLVAAPWIHIYGIRKITRASGPKIIAVGFMIVRQKTAVAATSSSQTANQFERVLTTINCHKQRVYSTVSYYSCSNWLSQEESLLFCYLSVAKYWIELDREMQHHPLLSVQTGTPSQCFEEHQCCNLCVTDGKWWWGSVCLWQGFLLVPLQTFQILKCISGVAHCALLASFLHRNLKPELKNKFLGYEFWVSLSWYWGLLVLYRLEKVDVWVVNQ